MIEDELLKWRFKRGSQEALRRIYEKYLDYLLTLAMALLNNASEAEDVVHDVFVSFAKSTEAFKLSGNLRSYLASCVLNRARDHIRSSRRHSIAAAGANSASSEPYGPEQSVISTEESARLNRAIAEIPIDQRETIILRVKGEMKFKEIAKLQGVSVNTVQGRYRYGLNKLRSILNGEVEK
jgi:RNA polymerase sigma-70 factor (ECF subfamily)